MMLDYSRMIHSCYDPSDCILKIYMSLQEQRKDLIFFQLAYFYLAGKAKIKLKLF